MGKRLFFSPKCLDRFWGPPALCAMCIANKVVRA